MVMPKRLIRGRSASASHIPFGQGGAAFYCGHLKHFSRLNDFGRTEATFLFILVVFQNNVDSQNWAVFLCEQL